MLTGRRTPYCYHLFKRCFKCGALRTDDCVTIDPRTGSEYPGHGAKDPVDACQSSRPTAVLLLRHLRIGTTEEGVREALRDFAQVKAVNMLSDARPGAPANPVALAEFHSVDYARHVMAATAKVPGAALTNAQGEVTSSSCVVGDAKARLYYAKASAMFLTALVPQGLPPGYAADGSRRVAAPHLHTSGPSGASGPPSAGSYFLPGKGMPPEKQAAFLQHSKQQQANVLAGQNGMAMAQSALATMTRRMGQYGVTLNGHAAGAAFAADGGDGGDDRDRVGSMGAEELSSALQQRILRKQGGGAPVWPPSFEEDGTAWVFDSASGYFLHAATEMYYEPKSRWYCRRSRDSGQYVYYHYHKGQDPPFVEQSATAAATAAVASSSPDATASTTAAAAAAATTAASSSVVPVVKTNTTTTTTALNGKKKPVSFGLSMGGGGKGKKGPGVASKHMKHMQNMHIWGARAREDESDEESEAEAAPQESSSSSSSSKSSDSVAQRRREAEALSVSAAKAKADAAAAAASTAALLAASPAANLLGPVVDPQVLGLDYASLGRLRLDGKPLVERPVAGSGAKWACLVSRRQFATEEQVAKHVRLSKLYKEELIKAIAAGRIVLVS